MENLSEFVQGPLFRLCFLIMILGLIRIFLIDVWNAYSAYRKAADKSMPWKLITTRSLEWLVPIKRIGNSRPIYSIISILFHIGLLITPIFLYAHVQLWEESIGIRWITLPYTWAYWLTFSTIIFAFGLFFGRVFNKSSSFISRKQDYLWPLLLVIPFISGFICAHWVVNPSSYQLMMLIHVLAGNLIFLLMPFTKIAHCVLMPLSQVICTLAWKFPPETNVAIAKTLNKDEEAV
jgi:nitrate reductase gamma subunit